MWVAFFLKISATVARSNVGPMPQSILLKRVGIETTIVGGTAHRERDYHAHAAGETLYVS
jgi:hypothetical protein